MRNPTSLCSFMIPLVLIGLLQACFRDKDKTQEAQQELVADLSEATRFMDVAILAKNADASQALMRAGTLDTRSTTQRPTKSINKNASFSDYSPYQLVQELQWMSSTGNPTYAPDIETILDLLRSQGYYAFWEVSEFLLRNKYDPDATPFDTWEHGLRQALLDMLLDFDMPEVEGMAFDLLKSQPSPMEIWQLGQYLENRSPGLYTQDIKKAAEYALVTADVSAVIPGQLFQILGEAGDGATVRLLADRPMHQDAYAAVALALIPDGSGLSLLEQDARLYESGQYTSQGRLAIELLALQAHRQDRAAAVLIDLAEKNLIPKDLWPRVLAIVSGQSIITLNPPVAGRLGAHFIYRPGGIQVIYRIAGSSSRGYSDLDGQRRYLLDLLQQLSPQT